MPALRNTLLVTTLTVSGALVSPALARDKNEITLFNAAGVAEAYIDLNNEMNIYLWNGTPVAYLYKNDGDGYHVYGFNGNHLGWFVKGAIWDHQGKAACALKEVLRNTEYEPYKGYKEYAPYKQYRDYAPYRPYLTSEFGGTPCRFLLAEGKG